MFFFFPQGEVMRDKKSVTPTHKGLTVVLGICGSKHKKSFEDGAGFLKYTKGLKWEGGGMG